MRRDPNAGLRALLGVATDLADALTAATRHGIPETTADPLVAAVGISRDHGIPEHPPPQPRSREEGLRRLREKSVRVDID